MLARSALGSATRPTLRRALGGGSLARSLRTSAPALSVQLTPRTSGHDYLATVNPQKFYESESLAAHQDRVRHDDPGNRTFNYAMIGPPPLAPTPTPAHRPAADLPGPPPTAPPPPPSPGGARFIAASAWRLALVKFLAQMNPSADVLALANLEVDISKLSEGECMTVKWRGKPVFIKSRGEDDIADAASVDLSTLRHPEADADRAQKPELLVVLGVCTHLGCVPINNAGDYGGWFCPCHGSHYDTSGRIRKGPAPLNLEVPPYSFLEEDKLLIG